MKNVKKNKTIIDTNLFQSGVYYGLKVSFLIEELIGLKEEGERLIPTDFIPLLDPVYETRMPTNKRAAEGTHQTEQAGPSHPIDQSQVPTSAAVPLPTEVRQPTTEGLKRKSTYYPTASEEERRMKKRKKRVDAEVERVFTKIMKGKGTTTEKPKKKKGAPFDPTKIVAKNLEFREPAEETKQSEDHQLMRAGPELLPIEAFHKLREDLALQAEYQNFEDDAPQTLKMTNQTLPSSRRDKANPGAQFTLNMALTYRQLPQITTITLAMCL